MTVVGVPESRHDPLEPDLSRRETSPETEGDVAMKNWPRDLLRRSPHSRRNQLARIIWHVVYCILFRPSPRFCHGWRRWLLRGFGAHVGHKVRVHPSIKIWAPWNLQLGDYSCIGDQVDCYSVGRLIIGEYATVSQYSILCGATHDHSYLHCPVVVGDIIIRPYAWICAQAFIMPNVTVGDGTVVGARSTVLEDLPSWQIAAGTPCRVVGPRRVRNGHS